MDFPYDRYEKLAGPLIVYYPSGDRVDDAQSKLEQEELARWIVQTIEKASQRLTQLFERPMPDMEIVVVKPEDWSLVPRGDLEEEHAPRPYWTDETSPPTLVVPTDIDPTFGTITREKIAFMLYHELALAFWKEIPVPGLVKVLCGPMNGNSSLWLSGFPIAWIASRELSIKTCMNSMQRFLSRSRMVKLR